MAQIKYSKTQTYELTYNRRDLRNQWGKFNKKSLFKANSFNNFMQTLTKFEELALGTTINLHFISFSITDQKLEVNKKLKEGEAA